ncbi:uncharacterized protein LOC134215829 [Armigeres subalbatus]|uniref:uncharacterized protein LOC134215829 n=1 Tax=Armigeres subalbatus TaxID=124917 RepID=UPI002ED2DE95
MGFEKDQRKYKIIGLNTKIGLSSSLDDGYQLKVKNVSTIAIQNGWIHRLRKDVKPPSASPNVPKKRGRKPKPFDRLSENSQHRRCRLQINDDPLEQLIWSAEKAARQSCLPALSKLLALLRKGQESSANEILQAFENRSIQSESSTEASLLLKTRLGLSKRKYEAIAAFSKQHLGVKLLQPWVKIIECRNAIIPPISKPNWDSGYLSSSVTVRNLVRFDVVRICDIEEVAEKVISEATDSGVLDLVVHVTGGVDSATGFTHYNQGSITGKDDSLLSEHYMTLMIVTQAGNLLWQNPSPQSDYFCRVRSMNWVKENDALTRSMFSQFMEELEDINRIPIEVHAHGKIILCGIYTLIDGKAANAIVGNRDTHACPLCVQGADPRIGPSLFHSRLNTVEWLIRHSSKKAVCGNPALTNPEVKAKMRQISNDLESHFKVQVNRPKPGGSGSSNNGNMARRLLSEPVKLAEILGINSELVWNLRIISCLALSSKRLDPNKVSALTNCIELQINTEFPFTKKLPPCIHKYTHLSEFIQRVPYPLSFLDEQAGERCHKRYKFIRPHLSRKTSPETNLEDMMKASLTWSDPKMSLTSLRKQIRQPTDEEFQERLKCYYLDPSDVQTDDFIEDMCAIEDSDDDNDE